MSGVVTFDPVAFAKQFREFSMQDPGVLTGYFAIACTILDNSGAGLVTDPVVLGVMFNLLTAHIALILGGADGEAPSQAVGRIKSAGEGSVHVDLDMGASTTNKAWYEQTKYGAMYWRMSDPYRSATYVPPPDQETYYIPGF